MREMDAMREVRAPGGFLENVLRDCCLLDRYAKVDSAVGELYVATSTGGITAVMEANDDGAFERSYHERFGRRCERDDSLAPELSKALAGGVEVAVDLCCCNSFQRAVLEATRLIPEGSVRPYAWVAQAIGRPKAVRAVGTALARNPVPLVVPCHRVVRSDGTSGRYALGGEREKVKLLEHEGVDLDEMHRRMHDRGAQYWTTEGEETFCRPYCFAARPLDMKIITFANAQEARAHGLVPCSTCQPLLAA